MTDGTTGDLRNITLRSRKLSWAVHRRGRPPNPADSDKNRKSCDRTPAGAGNRPAQRCIGFSAAATRQVLPGQGYRILDMKPGRFE
jgi:hypothetical protein